MYLSSRINHGRFRPEQISLPSIENELLDDLVKKLSKSSVKILAIDFDRTLIDDDSGSWMSFQNLYIRNQFFWLLKNLIKQKWICITSFNENLPTKFNEHLGIVTQTVVRRLLKLSDRNLSRDSIHQRLATEYKILIQSFPSRTYGKLEHIQNCVERIRELSSSTFEIQSHQILFFDDHPLNIKEAQKHFPSILIPIEEFNRKSQTLEPLNPLIDHLLEQSRHEHEKNKNKRTFSRGDR